MKSNVFIAEYFQYQACLNIEQGVNIWHLLNQVLYQGIPGDIVELGSLTGMTAAVLQRTLEDFGSDKRLWLFDSFEGLPAITAEDEKCPLRPENFKTSPEHTIQRFADLGLREPVIVPGWFADTLPDRLPEQVCFVHLDGDLYHSTKQGLEACYPRLPTGAVVVIDDYAEPGLCRQIGAAYNDTPYSRNSGRKYTPTDWLPGVRKACDEFLADKPEEILVLIAGDERHAFLRKL